MAEDRSPTSVREENRDEKKVPQVKDRKSLTGMSEKVKATLAPLLGGIKHHPEVEVDLGRESSAATYETVPMGSTAMSRYSTVEAPSATGGNNAFCDTGTEVHHPRTSDAGDPSLLDKVKDTVSGQVPGYGTYSGKGTSDANPNSDRLPTPVRDHLPVQDVGLGHSNMHSGTGIGRFDRDIKRESGKRESGVPGHNPNEDRCVLDGNVDPEDRFRSTTPTSEALHTEQGPRDDDVKRDGVMAKLMSELGTQLPMLKSNGAECNGFECALLHRKNSIVVSEN